MRFHKPPTVPVSGDEESRLTRVVYAPCEGCDGERPFLSDENGYINDQPVQPHHEYVDFITVLDEILEHCHFPKVQ